MCRSTRRFHLLLCFSHIREIVLGDQTLCDERHTYIGRMYRSEKRKKENTHRGGISLKRVYYIINKSKYGINCFDIDINGGIECDTQHISGMMKYNTNSLDIQKGIFIMLNDIATYTLPDRIILGSQIYICTCHTFLFFIEFHSRLLLFHTYKVKHF